MIFNRKDGNKHNEKAQGIKNIGFRTLHFLGGFLNCWLDLGSKRTPFSHHFTESFSTLLSLLKGQFLISFSGD